MKRCAICSSILGLLLSISAPVRGDVPALINYQGRMLNGTNLVNGNVSLVLRLYTNAAPVGGEAILYEDSRNPVAVVDGLYSTFIGDDTTQGSLATALAQPAIYLEVAVNGQPMLPRERLVAVPYAQVTEGVRSFGVTANMLATGAVQGVHIAANAIRDTHMATNSIGGDKITVGSLSADRIVPGSFVRVTGDTMTGSLTNQVGITAPRFDNSNNTDSGTNSAVMGGRLNTIEAGSDVSTIAGGRANRVLGYSATIGGGEGNQVLHNTAVIAGGYSNTVSASFGSIAGGRINAVSGQHGTVGGGWQNRAAGSLAAVGGGWCNLAGGTYSTVAGGISNTANAYGAFVGGGGFNGLFIRGNSAIGESTVVAGGFGNLASNSYSCIPGGVANVAGGWCSLAAGFRAKALHDGAFVWADSTDADYGSATNDSFNVRACGGVFVDTGTNPGISLNAANEALVTRGYDAFTSGTHAGAGRWGVFMEPHRLVAGIPAIGGKEFHVAKYNADSSYTSLVSVDQNGNLFTLGAVNPPSDRGMKTDFVAVDPAKIAAAVAALPVSTWRYKEDAGGSRHMGPVAQDFRAAFGLGTDERHIATVDADGVALAAIQGLYRMVEERDRRIRDLEERLQRLEARLQPAP